VLPFCNNSFSPRRKLRPLAGRARAAAFPFSVSNSVSLGHAPNPPFESHHWIALAPPKAAHAVRRQWHLFASNISDRFVIVLLETLRATPPFPVGRLIPRPATWPLALVFRPRAPTSTRNDLF